MENLDAYLDKFSENGKRILATALSETRRRNQNFISPEHILYALIVEETDYFNSAIKELTVDPNSIKAEVEELLEYSPVHSGQGFRIAPETTEIFKYSMDRARSQGRRIIETSDILYTLVRDETSLLNNILQKDESDKETITLRGQVRKIDLDAKQFEFRNTPNNELNKVRCIYKNYTDEQASEWLNKFVTVIGFLERGINKSFWLMKIETVEIDLPDCLDDEGRRN